MATSYISVVASWGVIFMIGGIATYIYKPDLVTQLLPTGSAGSGRPATNASEAPKVANKPKKTNKSKTEKETNSHATTTSSEEARASKKRKITAPIDKTVTATAVNGKTSELPRDTENDLNDKAFAQQLAKAQAGTKLQSKSNQQVPGQARPASSLQPSRSEDKQSTAHFPSTTGLDVDDDLSSDESPQQHYTSGKDISDMLEKPGTAPTTLRLTNLQEKEKKPKSEPKQFEQSETKKQRQRRLRQEEQKRANQEAEKLRQKQMQQQLQGARMAAGTSNQTKANSFASTANSAWNSKPNTAESIEPKPAAASLLDTFEPTTATKESVQVQPLSEITSQSVSSNNVSALQSKVGTNTASALGASGRENGNLSDQTSHSEEDQLDRVRQQDQDNSWESVQSKKVKRKGRKDDTSSEASFAVSEPQRTPSQPKIKPPQSNGPSKPTESNNRFNAIQLTNANGLRDDEWTA